MIHIKEVANQTKITVRTLRYYDQIELLTAPSKTEGGHRLYSEEEIKKLQCIQFFKGMGYKLHEIREILSDPNWNWTNSLKGQLACILEEQERLRRMELSVKELITSIATEDGDEWLAVHKLIQLSGHPKNSRQIFKEHVFDDEEMKLLRKVPKMKGEDPDSLEWIALMGQLKRYTNEDPASAKVQNIIRRMLEKQMEDFPDNEEFINKLWDIRKSQKQSESLGLYPIDKEVLVYMERAYDIYISNPQHTSFEQGG